jgi:uncharacterized protein YjiS (DUF1127 family)
MRHAQAQHGHPETRSLASHALSLAQRAWRTYWAHKAEQTTVLILRSLDDRTLKDIGMDRSEIESVVYTATRGRRSGSCRSAERRIAMCV